MNAAKQAIWLFFTMIALACSGLYFASSKQVIKLDDQTLLNSADMVINDLTVRRYDEKGRLINFLQTPEMQHIPNQNTNFLKLPQITIAQENQADWQISSVFAKALNGGQQITFTEKVIVHQPKSEHNQESTIKTEELTYFAKDKLAVSSKAVRFEQPGTIVNSEGMKAYLADKRIQLLNHARATYEPKHA